MVDRKDVRNSNNRINFPPSGHGSYVTETFQWDRQTGPDRYADRRVNISQYRIDVLIHAKYMSRSSWR